MLSPPLRPHPPLREGGGGGREVGSGAATPGARHWQCQCVECSVAATAPTHIPIIPRPAYLPSPPLDNMAGFRGLACAAALVGALAAESPANPARMLEGMGDDVGFRCCSGNSDGRLWVNTSTVGNAWGLQFFHTPGYSAADPTRNRYISVIGSGVGAVDRSAAGFFGFSCGSQARACGGWGGGGGWVGGGGASGLSLWHSLAARTRPPRGLPGGPLQVLHEGGRGREGPVRGPAGACAPVLRA
jgi:hypothetical protein